MKIFGHKSSKSIDIVFEFGGLTYAIRNVLLVKEKNGEWESDIEEAYVVHFDSTIEKHTRYENPELDCQCGHHYNGNEFKECEYMDALVDWVWEGLFSHPQFFSLYDDFSYKEKKEKKIVHLNEYYNPFE